MKQGALEAYARLVDRGIIGALALYEDVGDEETIGGAITLYDALDAADEFRPRLRAFKRDELIELALVGVAVGIYDGEADRMLAKVARGEPYDPRFPAPPCCGQTESSAEGDLDLEAIAVEETIEGGASEHAERGILT